MFCHKKGGKCKEKSMERALNCLRPISVASIFAPPCCTRVCKSDLMLCSLHLLRQKKINDGFPVTGPRFEGSVGRKFFFFFFNFFSWYRTHITHIFLLIFSQLYTCRHFSSWLIFTGHQCSITYKSISEVTPDINSLAQLHFSKNPNKLIFLGCEYIVACQRGGISNETPGQRQDTGPGILWSVHRGTRPTWKPPPRQKLKKKARIAYPICLIFTKTGTSQCI